MPSYDIIPLASDLLDYTIQRVKQKEAEYKPVKAYIMVGDQLVEKLLYDKVKDDGKPHFPKSQTFHLCAELQWQYQQQQLQQLQRVPPRSDGKVRPSRPKAESSAIHHIKGGHIQP